ncbi:hypothetical protein N0V94_000665 [Neodidymelliopsis sp. IMI 364377]|nr:hypothetical protein N0V94_000665 [Neodidymelliopsis sp. IMI 364377]
MPLDIDDDEYVAKLLAQDAKKSSKTYDLVGLDAFNPKRSKSGAPKLNTNFLRNIIRQTDSHNAALLAKEAEESSSRLRQMNRDKEKERTEAVDRAKRRIEGRLKGSERVDTENTDQNRDRGGTKIVAGINDVVRDGMETATKIEQHTNHDGEEIIAIEREKMRDPISGVDGNGASDSDPLEAIVGPLPPAAQPAVRSRGRGALKANSTGIESRFSSTYDPLMDVRPDSDAEDDWGEALQVMRDRERWKQQGADRLRAAGFKDEQVKKWEKGGDPIEDDVVWTKKGQSREWDRGKVLDEDGDVELKADWGRLK